MLCVSCVDVYVGVIGSRLRASEGVLRLPRWFIDQLLVNHTEC